MIRLNIVNQRAKDMKDKAMSKICSCLLGIPRAMLFGKPLIIARAVVIQRYNVAGETVATMTKMASFCVSPT
jgi:hypothetical protein